MFLCVSLNPGVDKRLRVAHLQPGAVNRATEVMATPGGKAAHVAMVLRTLGADPLWLGLSGGPPGAVLVEGLRAMSIRVQSVAISGATRVNLEIIDHEGEVTEILEPGPSVSSTELQQLQDTYETILKSCTGKATVILSGSLPTDAPADCYRRLVELGHQQGGRVFVDSSGEALRQALKAHPDFVKPNRQEAEWLTGGVIDGLQSGQRALCRLLEDGARGAAISLGETGLLWQAEKRAGAFCAYAPAVTGRSCVGSGDAALAALAFGTAQGMSPADTLKLAAACGAANCLADSPGRARAEDIHRLKASIRVERMG